MTDVDLVRLFGKGHGALAVLDMTLQHLYAETVRLRGELEQVTAELEALRLVQVPADEG